METLSEFSFVLFTFQIWDLVISLQPIRFVLKIGVICHDISFRWFCCAGELTYLAKIDLQRKNQILNIV